jgi:hypothetical protein
VLRTAKSSSSIQLGGRYFAGKQRGKNSREDGRENGRKKTVEKKLEELGGKLLELTRREKQQN